ASKIARDISEQLEKENKVKEYTERLEILNNIGKTISGKMDIPSIMRTVIQATTKTLNADFGILYYQNLGKDSVPLQRVNTVGLPKSFLTDQDLNDTASGPYPFSLSKKSYLINDVNTKLKLMNNHILKKIRQKFHLKSVLS